ncbi:hypothetical protein PVAP13_J013857 [Panicum virgatum]|jgi:hypothetical protein|nr:hypothetical protein PVAP13_J013857 [Panicum virgatum]
MLTPTPEANLPLKLLKAQNLGKRLETKGSIRHLNLITEGKNSTQKLPFYPTLLLSSRESIHPLSVYGELSLEHRLRFVLNGKMEHLTTHLHRPRTTRSPLSFWGDGGIVPFEPFFHAFPGGLEKAVINRTSLILPS